MKTWPGLPSICVRTQTRVLILIYINNMKLNKLKRNLVISITSAAGGLASKITLYRPEAKTSVYNCVRFSGASNSTQTELGVVVSAGRIIPEA